MKALVALLILLIPVAYAEVSEIQGVPILTPLTEEEYAYQYLNVTEPQTIEFNVNKSWIEENDINSVYLSVYKGNKWNEINTIKTGSADEYNTYRAEAQIPSYYAIFGTQTGEQYTPPPQTGLLTSRTTSILGAIISLVIILFLLYASIGRRMGRKVS